MLVHALLAARIFSAVPDSIAPDQTGMSTRTALEFASNIRVGMTIGYTLESFGGGESNGGNPFITQEFVDAIRAAGFNAIRLNVSLYQFADASGALDTAWLHRVQEVVDYAHGRGMFVMVQNWWFDKNSIPLLPGASVAKSDSLLPTFKTIMKQVAIRFRDYDERFILEGVSESQHDYGFPAHEYLDVADRYNQAFVDAIRSTGGRNAFRYLALHPYGGTMAYLDSMRRPTDDRLIVAVNFFDPSSFTFENVSTESWGKGAPSNASWGQEPWVDRSFAHLKSTLVDSGIPVFLSEYNAMKRTNSAYEPYRLAWIDYVTKAAVANGVRPFYYDNGKTAAGGNALFDRLSNRPYEPVIIDSLMSATKPLTVSAARASSSPSQLVHQGDVLLSEDANAIALHDLSGRLVRRSELVDGTARLPLAGLRGGLYVARSNGESRTVLVR